VSVQFGRWNFDGEPVDPDYLEKVKPLLAPYGSDDDGFYSKGNITILYGAFHTTKESRRETQPHITSSGTILTWDGRLDNRMDLIRRMCEVLTNGSTDVEIVAAAYEYWRSDCFGMLIGDWTLSIWDPRMRSLILAKDPIGTRHLYYSLDNNHVTWSTILDPLVLFAGKTFTLCEEYIAGWLSFFPAAHVTPYAEIHSVPPSYSVLLRPGNHTVSKYWDFDPNKRIRYRTDAEYEEHFRAVFTEAVRHRLRSDSPILAELSGGMDSCSIVCMADELIGHGKTNLPRLDTVSYYDDSEPNWNERPYFAKVEEKRGRVGYHVDVSPHEQTNFSIETRYFPATPGSGAIPSETAQKYFDYQRSQGYRVLLSGIGGDEALGGVPNPIPELADLLVSFELRQLAHQLKKWSLVKRKPWVHLFFETIGGFLPVDLCRAPEQVRKAPWLHPHFVGRYRSSLTTLEPRFSVFGPLPSFQANLSTLNAMRNQLGSKNLDRFGSPEKRYPYLDRNLLEFLCAVPREQLIRPGQRRSLMRRALAGTVPEEILNRKRKAFVARKPVTRIAEDWSSLSQIPQQMILGTLGIVDSKKLLEALQSARSGREVSVTLLMRPLGLELWLRTVQRWSVLRIAGSGCIAAPSPSPGSQTKAQANVTRADLLS